MTDKLKLVIQDHPANLRMQLRVVEHGDSFLGLDAVGIVEGSFCDDECDWCSDLRIRIRNRNWK